ncbi:MAG: hypothetical protein L6Q84_35285 [Polyangiaceae bacterium]|nr:hypothetical protein [Polyangiaceae bacterium]
MLMLRWVAATLLLTVFAIVALGNAWAALRFYARGRSGSQVPFLGGIVGLVGVLTLPIGHVSWVSWIPLVADIGCLPLAVRWLFARMRKKG